MSSSKAAGTSIEPGPAYPDLSPNALDSLHQVNAMAAEIWL
jgi:hypothetical protein